MLVDCKREIHDFRGAIESPNFPASYPPNLECEWKLTPPLGNKLYVEFSHFKLEHFDDDADSLDQCNFDYLIIEEVDAENEISTKKHCSHMPKAFTTTHTVIFKCVNNHVQYAAIT